MIPLSIHLDGDGCWPDLAGAGDRMIRAQLNAIARLPMGMGSGKSSIAVRIDLPDGRVVIAETSLVLLRSALRAIEVREEMEASAQVKPS